MFIGYAIETFRDGVPRNAASTPDVEAILAADCCVKEASRPTEGCNAVRDSDCDPGLVDLSGRCGITENLIPSL